MNLTCIALSHSRKFDLSKMILVSIEESNHHHFVVATVVEIPQNFQLMAHYPKQNKKEKWFIRNSLSMLEDFVSHHLHL